MRQMALPRGESGAKSCRSASSAGTPSWAARAASRLGVRSVRAAEIAGVAGVAAADVDDAPPTRILHERDDGPGAAQRAHILDVEILDQILVDDGFDRAGRGGRPAWVGPAIDQDVQTAQLLRRLRAPPAPCW